MAPRPPTPLQPSSEMNQIAMTNAIQQWNVAMARITEQQCIIGRMLDLAATAFPCRLVLGTDGTHRVYEAFPLNLDVSIVVDHIPLICAPRELQRKDVLHAKRWDILLEIVLTRIG
ncbi:hypothetical protein ACSQ67_010383 [Phaseolus vulgaris]